MATSATYAAGVTAAEVALSIAPGLAKKAISATVNGAHYDLQWPITTMPRIAIHTMQDDAQALELIRHDCAHIMARAVQEIWPDVKVTIGPVRDYGWFYDFDRAEPFTPEDLGAIEARMKQIINARDPVRTEVWDRARAIAYYEERERAVQDRAHQPHSRRRRPADVLARRLARPLPWPASGPHRPGARRCLQADPCGRRLLAGRCDAPDVAAHLWPCLPEPRRSEGRI